VFAFLRSNYAVNLEKVRSDHPLRAVAAAIGFKSVREEVAQLRSEGQPLGRFRGSLESVAAESPPTRALKVIVVGGIGKVSFHLVLRSAPADVSDGLVARQPRNPQLR
jgi:hypothetical protein